MVARTTTSIRLDPRLREELAQFAGREGTTVTALLERFAWEGLAAARHPGIVFRSGPSGRRASLAGGPDVWEITSALRHTSGSERARVARLAKEFGLHERQIGIALDYAAANAQEIQARVAANDRALVEVEQLATQRARLLA